MKFGSCFSFLTNLFTKRTEEGAEKVNKETYGDVEDNDEKNNMKNSDVEMPNNMSIEHFDYTPKCQDNDDLSLELEEYILDGTYMYKYDIAETRLGYVFAVENVHTHKTYALKTTPKMGRYIPDESAPNELQILEALSGLEGIVKLIDAFIENEQYCIVYEKELCNMEEMLQKFPDQTLSHLTSLKLIYQLVSVLENIHMAGYLHRDVRPKSLLISRNNSMIIGGFHVAYQFKKMGISQWSYMQQVPSFRRDFSSAFSSPNQISNSHQDERDDFISVFFCLLTFLGYKNFMSFSYSEKYKFLNSPDTWVAKKDENFIPLLMALLAEKNEKPCYNLIYEQLNKLDPNVHYTLPLNLADDGNGYRLD